MNKNERSPINSDLLRAFLAVSDHGSLTTAAASLHKTQSALSVQLRKLEGDLGVTLFERSVRGMQPTPEGRKLVPVAREALTALNRTRTLFEAPLSGPIRVGIPDDFDDGILQQVLAHFTTEHPGVEVIATSGCTSQFPALIKKGKLDVAVCSGPNAIGTDILSVEPTVWAIAQSTRFSRRHTLALAQLDRNCWWRDIATNALNDAGIPYRIAFNSNSFASLKAAVSAGFAIGSLPRSSIVGNLREISPHHKLPSLPASVRTIVVGKGIDQPVANAFTASLHAAVAVRTE